MDELVATLSSSFPAVIGYAKLSPVYGPVAADIVEARTDQSFEELAIPVENGGRAGMLLGPHRDPFD